MLWVLLIAAFLNLLAIFLLAMGWRRHTQFPKAAPQPLSVIVAARNEAHNLPNLLDALQSQDHPGPYECIVALDRCTDGSLKILQDHARHNPRIRWIEIDQTPAGWSPKKYALAQAIAAARHDRLAFTDADCVPQAGWLSGIDAHLASGAELVLGLAPYTRHPGLLNAFVHHETFHTALLYTGLAGWGFPYMGVGRNLAYTRSFYERAGGFGPHKNRLSGDDDLLVNKNARGPATVAMTTPGTWAFSEPPRTFGDWRAQKLRHMSAGASYTPLSKLILAGFHGLQLIFYVSLGLVLCIGPDGAWGAGVAGLRALLAIGIIAPLRWPDRNRLLTCWPILDLLYLLYLLAIGPAGMGGKPKWRGK